MTDIDAGVAANDGDGHGGKCQQCEEDSHIKFLCG